jgi:hypothetical protein
MANLYREDVLKVRQWAIEIAGYVGPNLSPRPELLELAEEIFKWVAVKPEEPRA